MGVTTVSSRQFNQDAGWAKRAAADGPVFITDRGRPAHVLLTFEQYKKMAREEAKIADLLAMPHSNEVELELTTARDLAQAANFD